MKEKELTSAEQTAYVFAARYTHNRQTGGTLAVVKALEVVWVRLSHSTKRQIEKEAYHEATANRDDWNNFFSWENELPKFLKS